MKTTVYIIRHSETFNQHIGFDKSKEKYHIKDMSLPLSINGELMAEKKSKEHEFDNVDVIYSSHYARSLATAKYFAFNNNIKVNIDDRLGERIRGMSKIKDLEKDFEIHQFNDEDFKLSKGENQKEVRKRMYDALMDIIKENEGKRILIFSHQMAISFLLTTWCNMSFNDYSTFDNEIFFDGKWDYLETFKLEFNSNYDLINIVNIK